MNNWCICWFSRIFLLGILIFKRLTARRLYKSFGVKGLSLISFTAVEQLAVFLDFKILGQLMYITHQQKSERGNHRRNKTSTDIYA
jgi:hypothetical protein